MKRLSSKQSRKGMECSGVVRASSTVGGGDGNRRCVKGKAARLIFSCLDVVKKSESPRRVSVVNLMNVVFVKHVLVYVLFVC